MSINNNNNIKDKNNKNENDGNKNKKNNSNNNSSIKCPYCGSIRINKNGNKYNKQRYICTHCKKSFSFNDKRVKRSDRERELALLLYVHNSSIRSIQSVISKFFDTKISFNLIDNWIKTYAKQLKRDIEMKDVEDNEDYNKEIEDNNINDKEKEEEGKEKENKELKESNVNNNNSSSKKENKDSISNNIKDNVKDNNNKGSVTNNNDNNINNNNDYNNTNGNITEKNKPKPKPKTIDILELDELYSYFYDLKKNEKRESKYGLLLIGTEIKLLHLK